MRHENSSLVPDLLADSKDEEEFLQRYLHFAS
jgi:hypothetical protein